MHAVSHTVTILPDMRGVFLVGGILLACAAAYIMARLIEIDAIGRDTDDDR